MNGIELIKSFEGCKLKAYQDSVGVWTIGYGRTTNVHKGDVITQQQADDYLLIEYKEFESKVKKLVKVPLTDNQLGALVCFAYNVGVGALSKSTLLKKLNVGDYKGAAEQFLVWNKAGGKILNGLVRRRQAEKDLFLS